jgi:putative methionine-R-sulfoxide reductase with GAF domain
MVCSHLQSIIPFDCFAVYLKFGESIVPQCIDGPCSGAFSTRQMPIGEGLSGWVAQSAWSIVNGNPTMEPNYHFDTGVFTATSSALSIPLLDPAGAIFGVLTLYSAASAAFSKDHLRILEAIESKFSLSLQNALRFRIAETDAEMGHSAQLPNMHGSEAAAALESLVAP